MIGAIAGDMIGSVYEAHPIKTTSFPLWAPRSRMTDDTVLTVATAHAILEGVPYGRAYHEFGRRHPDAGYGRAFRGWIASHEPQPYDSWGNGSAMRVSPVAWAFDSIDSVLHEAEQSARPTHGHPEGIKGARAVALAIFLARSGESKEEIRREVGERSGYDLERTVESIRPAYRFDVSCQGSVPEALIAFFDSTDYESAVRLAVSLGGDADTQASIAGAVAEAFYGFVPDEIREEARARLPLALREVLDAFVSKYGG